MSWLSSRAAPLVCFSRKGRDLYLWMAKCPNGSSVKFLVNAVHTMEELKLTGNHLKGSQPLLTFSSNFNKISSLEAFEGDDHAGWSEVLLESNQDIWRQLWWSNIV